MVFLGDIQETIFLPQWHRLASDAYVTINVMFEAVNVCFGILPRFSRLAQIAREFTEPEFQQGNFLGTTDRIHQHSQVRTGDQDGVAGHVSKACSLHSRQRQGQTAFR